MSKNVKLYDRKLQIHCLTYLAHTLTRYNYTLKVAGCISNCALGSDGLLADSILDLLEDIQILRRQRRKVVYCSFESMSLVALVVLVGMPAPLERDLQHLIVDVLPERAFWVRYWGCD